MTEGPEQTPAFRSYDGMFRYAGPTGHEGRCYLQVFERRGALPIILYVICHQHMMRCSQRGLRNVELVCRYRVYGSMSTASRVRRT